MRSRLIAAVVAAGLSDVGGARAEDTSAPEDPCAEDVKKFCSDVKLGAGRVWDCLRKNEASLAPACNSKRKATEERFKAFVTEFAAACKSDAARLCSEVPQGKGRVIACLLRQQDDLSSTCRAVTDRIQTAAETIKTVRDACRADVERLCGGVPPDAGSLVECLQAHKSEVSATCRSVDPARGMQAAEVVDAIDTMSSEERAHEALQILQGIESIAFSRSQVLFQVDSFKGFAGAANVNRLLFNPQIVFGHRNQFSFQMRAPILSVYPYASDQPAQTGLGSITTALAWAFFASPHVHQYLSCGLQWISPEHPPIGSAWAVTPGYAISVGIVRALSITGQVAWLRTFAGSGYPEVNLLLLDPVVVLNLPGRSFLAVDTKLAWNLVDRSFLPVVKGIAGLYVDRRKSLSISAWYQTALSHAAEDQVFKYGVGTALAYTFDW
ncbi:MAG: cysteine rich repeat-containing protein [Polyangiales bacterium]